MEFEFDLIEKIKPQPALFLGELSISKLRAFLDGYRSAIRYYNIPNPKTVQPLPFWFFHEYVARYYGFSGSTSGWVNMILKQVNNEKEGLALFFELFNNFRNIQIESLYSCVINQEHLDYHYHDKRAPKQFTDDKLNIKKPLYENAQKIYYAKLSDNIGFLGFVETDKAYEMIQEIYKEKMGITDYWQCCFGHSLDWQSQEYGSIDFDGKDIL